MADEPLKESAIWDRLRTVFDPEIPVNIADLGLVYACRILGRRVEIEMTLTAPGCSMGEEIAEEARRKIAAIPGVEEVEVKLVFEPPWNRDMMSEAAKLQLGMLW